MSESFAKWQECCPEVTRDRDLIDGPKRTLIGRLMAAHAKRQAAWPLLLWGPAGVGKTCAALCLLDYANANRKLFPGWRPAYITAGEWVAVMTAAKLGQYEPSGCRGPISESDLWHWWTVSSVICLDEIGARDKVSDTHYEIVKMSLDRRQGQPLVLVSNLGPTELSRVYDDRIASRMAGGTVIKFVGQDRRVSK